MSNTFCHFLSRIEPYFDMPWVIFFITISIVVVAITIIALLHVLKKYQSLFLKTLAIFIAISLICLMLVLGLFVFMMGKETVDRAFASNYFQMNAAIKNTCYLDPLRQNCPQNLEQLVGLYRPEFSAIVAKHKTIYRYYPETNEYTLIIVDRADRAVIFDPRLAQTGFDFREVTLNPCQPGSILNPPSFPGPWDQI